MLKSVLAVLILALVAGNAVAEDPSQIAARLDARLKNGIIRMRVPRVGVAKKKRHTDDRTVLELRFDADGESKNPVGIAGFDDKYQVESVQIENSELLIKAIPLQDIYHPDQQQVGFAKLPEIAEIRIATADPTSEARIAESYAKVFLQKAEVAARPCADLTYLQDFAARPNKKKDKSRALQPSKLVCLPSGSSAWTVGNDTSAPKPIKTPDPSYPEAERAARINSGVNLVLRIDETGKITDVVLLSTGTVGFDLQTVDSLRKWMFIAAEHDGKSAPAVIEVQFSFWIG